MGTLLAPLESKTRKEEPEVQMTLEKLVSKMSGKSHAGNEEELGMTLVVP